MPSLNFKGKPAVWNHHLSVPYHTLEKDAKKSLKGKNDDENLIIHGDNLLALKALLPQYQGKVKCIYIDPPYNTGNESWVYSDSVSSPTIKEWVGKTVGKEGEDLTRHDKWLCMMTPRLKMLRELLTDDGAIFISIDDNEVADLVLLMNEVFLESNFISTIVWKRKRGRDNSAKFFSKSHEYIICYAKDATQAVINKLKISAETMTAYRNPDKDQRGQYRLLGAWARGTQGGSHYAFQSKEGRKFGERLWLMNKKALTELDLDDRLVYVGDKIYRKLFLNEHTGSVPETIWDDASNAANAADEIKKLFGEQIFDTVKPTPLIRRILHIATDQDSIILDSFAGSGTTAHAVLDLNKEDGGNRKFILVEMEDYADKITAERVRRACKQNGYDAGFTYKTLGSAIDAESLLSGKLPTYKEFAKYVYYLATGKNHPDESKIKETDGFVGKGDGASVYLLYKPNVEALKNMAVTLDWAQRIDTKDKGRKVVYAPACYLDEEMLERYNITFVGIPYNLFERAA